MNAMECHGLGDDQAALIVCQLLAQTQPCAVAKRQGVEGRALHEALWADPTRGPEDVEILTQLGFHLGGGVQHVPVVHLILRLS